MSEILDTIGNYLWVCDFISLGILLFLAWQNKEISSSLIAVAIAVIIGGVSLQYGPLVLSIKGPDTSTGARIAWYVTFAVLDVIAIFALYKVLQHYKQRLQRTFNVLLTMLVVSVIISGITIQYGPLLFEMQGPDHKMWVRFAWYMGFVVLNGLAIYAIYKTHSAFGKRNSFITRMVLLTAYVISICHIIRFAERYTWDTDHLEAIYRWSIVSINTTATIVTFIIVCVALYRHYRIEETTMERAIWKI